MAGFTTAAEAAANPSFNTDRRLSIFMMHSSIVQAIRAACRARMLTATGIDGRASMPADSRARFQDASICA
jgi:hypothetical protein